MKFLGHVMRRDEVDNMVLTGPVEGKRAKKTERKIYEWCERNNQGKYYFYLTAVNDKRLSMIDGIPW